jgi:hypothetical protein
MAKLTGPEGVGFGASRSSGGIQGAPGRNVQPDFKIQRQTNQTAIDNIRKTLNMPKKPQEVTKAVKKVDEAREVNRTKNIKNRLRGL